MFQRGSSLEESLDFDIAERLTDFERDIHFKEMVDLLSQLITVDPVSRLSCEEALEHPWIQTSNQEKSIEKISESQVKSLSLINRAKLQAIEVDTKVNDKLENTLKTSPP